MPYLVYKIANTVNSKLYVGRTIKSLEERWRSHISSCEHVSTQTCTALYADMREHGIDKFSIALLEECPDHVTMMNHERDWIRQLNSRVPYGYNLSVRLLTDEQIAIIRFNAYKLTIKDYARLFGVSTATVSLAKTGKGSHFLSDPFAYITRDHLPQERDALLAVQFTKAHKQQDERGAA